MQLERKKLKSQVKCGKQKNPSWVRKHILIMSADKLKAIDAAILKSKFKLRGYGFILDENEEIYIADKADSGIIHLNPKYIKQYKNPDDKTKAKLKQGIINGAMNNMIKEIIKRNVSSRDVLDQYIKHKFTLFKRSFVLITKLCGFKDEEWSKILGVPLTRIQSQTRFNHLQSLHIMQILILFNYGIEIFGNKTKFKKWLRTKNDYFENSPPQAYLESPAGVNILYDELIKIDYGVIA